MIPAGNGATCHLANCIGRGMGIAQAIEPLYQQVRVACPQEADGVLIAGTGFRCVGILHALERDLQRPVVSANQASPACPAYARRSAVTETCFVSDRNMMDPDLLPRSTCRA
jgi:hypothetical protein